LNTFNHSLFLHTAQECYTVEYIQSFSAPTHNTAMLHCWIQSVIPCSYTQHRNVKLLNTFNHSLFLH